jgi:RHS repeat-associated protein
MSRFRGILKISGNQSSFDGELLAKAGIPDLGQALAAATGFLLAKGLSNGSSIVVAGEFGQLGGARVILMIDAVRAAGVAPTASAKAFDTPRGGVGPSKSAGTRTKRSCKAKKVTSTKSPRGKRRARGLFVRTTLFAMLLSAAPAAFAQSDLPPIIENDPLPEHEVQQNELLKGAAGKSVRAEALEAAGSVTPDGAFTYKIPLRVPTGIRGMQPQIAIVYNSLVKNGLVGTGFSLTGIPEIHRVNAGRGINYDTDDDYAVNFGGWGTPDNPALRLVYVGSDPHPIDDRVSQSTPPWLINLSEYIFDRVWHLQDPTCPTGPADCRWTAMFTGQLGQHQPPYRFRGRRVPSADIAAFANGQTAAPAPVEAIDLQASEDLWYTFNVTNGALAPTFSWPCEPTAIRCWLRTLHIDPHDWVNLNQMGALNVATRVVEYDEIYHTYDESWGEYRPRGTCGDGPCYWVMKDGNGNTYYFGGDESFHPSDSSEGGTSVYPVLTERFNGASGERGIYVWGLYKVVDHYGNGYKVVYLKSYDSIRAITTFVPREIQYLESSGASLAKTITFYYEDDRTDTTASAPYWFTQRLSGVVIFAGDSVLRKYALAYETGADGRSRLRTFQELGPDLNPVTGLPPHVFTWYEPPPLNQASKVTLLRGVQLAPGEIITGDPFYGVPTGGTPLVGDFNGDGRSDVVWAQQDFHGLLLEYALGSDGGLTAPTSPDISSFYPNAGSSWPQPKPGKWDRNAGCDPYPNCSYNTPDRYFQFAAGDINGDGVTDLIAVQFGPDAISIWSSSMVLAGGPLLSNLGPLARFEWKSEYGDPDWINWRLFVLDLNNDHIADIVAVHPGSPTILTWYGNTRGVVGPLQPGIHWKNHRLEYDPNDIKVRKFRPYNKVGNAEFGVYTRIQFADINGDGALDLLTTFFVYHSDGWTDFQEGATYALGTEANGFETPVSVAASPFYTVLADINGDGHADLISPDQILLGRSGASNPLVPRLKGGGVGVRIDHLADVDGDGILDGFYPDSDGGCSVVLGDPIGRFGFRNLITRYPGEGYYSYCFGLDLNGDGKSEIVALHGPDQTLAVGFGASTPGFIQLTNISPLSSLANGSLYSRGDPRAWQSDPARQPRAVGGDFNGDGLQDALFFPWYATGAAWALPASNTLPELISQPPSLPADLLLTVSNGIGGKLNITYESAVRYPGNHRTPLPLPKGAHEALNASSRPVVTRLDRDNGRGLTRSLSYEYRDGLMHPGGRPFDDSDLGFAEVDVTDVQTHIRTATTYRQDHPFQQRPSKIEVFSAKGNLVKSESYTYDQYAPYSGVEFVRLIAKKATDYELGTQTAQTTETYSYDAYGRLRTLASTTGKLTTIAESTYNNNPDTWILGRIEYSKLYSHRPQVGTAPLIDYIINWEHNIYAGNGIELQARYRLLCDAEEDCHCPGGKDCTASLPARWVAIEQNRTYDAQGNPQYSEDAYGHGTRYVFDPDWGAIKTTTRMVTESNGTVVALVTSKHYDGAGRLDIETDANAVVTSYSYDAFDRPKQIDRPSGAHVFYDYLDWGDPSKQRIVRTTGPLASSASANLPLGEAVTDLFDGVGQVYEEDTTAGEDQTIQQSRFETFDSAGHKLYYNKPMWAGLNHFPPQDASDEWIRISFDEADRPQLVQSFPGENGSPTTVASYAFAPLKITITDEHSSSITTVFDDRRRVAKKQDAFGTWTYTYDAADRLASVAMPNGGQLAIRYDGWGRRRFISDPSIGSNSYVLDDLGNPLRVTDGNGIRVSYTYDELGRILTKSGAQGTRTYTYDVSSADFTMGRLASVTDAVGTTSLKYDRAGNLAERSQTLPANFGASPLVCRYVWDFLGRIQTRILGEATTVDYSYPDGRNLRAVLVNGKLMATFANYDPNRLPGIRVTPASTTRMSHDPRGVLIDLKTVSSRGVILQNLRLTNDVSGFIKSIADNRTDKTISSRNTDETLSFNYDADNRLRTASSPAWGTSTYKYDAVGNLVRKASVSFNVSANRIVAHSGGHTATASFDSAGSRTDLDSKEGYWHFTYDDEHHLSVASLTSGSMKIEGRFLYDYDGRRIAKVITKPDGEEIVTLYCEGLELRKSSKAPQNFSTTVHVGAARVGTIASITTGSIPGQPKVSSPPLSSLHNDTTMGPAVGTVFHHSSWNNSTSVLTDSAGNLVAHLMYEPFGELVTAGSVGQDAATIKFTGKELDEETGLSYFGARYYDARFGRFVTPDSRIPGAGVVPQGFNRYTYALNNPIRLLDPDGRDPLPNIQSNYYVPPGYWMQWYQYYAGIATDTRNGFWTRAGASVIGALEYVPAAVEEIGRGILNIPYDADQAGQLAARASVEPNIFAKVDDYSAATASFSRAFNNALVVAAPLATGVKAPVANPTTSVTKAATFGAGSLGAGEAGVLQTGRNTISDATAKALNQLTELDLSRREWGRALEALKKANDLPPNYHGKILSTGDYADMTGNIIDSILDYVKGGLP